MLCAVHQRWKGIIRRKKIVNKRTHAQEIETKASVFIIYFVWKSNLQTKRSKDLASRREGSRLMEWLGIWRGSLGANARNHFQEFEKYLIEYFFPINLFLNWIIQTKWFFEIFWKSWDNSWNNFIIMKKIYFSNHIKWKNEWKKT